jgi:hypothetical protein
MLVRRPLPLLCGDPFLRMGSLGSRGQTECFFGGASPLDEIPAGWPEEPGVDHPVQLGDQRFPESIDVEQDDRFAVQPQLRPGGDLSEFLQRAQATGEGDEGIGQVVHELLALMHRPDLVQRGQARVGDFTGEQARWDYPDDPAAVAESGIGQLTHEANAAPPVDKVHAAAGDQDAQSTGSIPVAGISRYRRPAEHTDRAQSHHQRNLSDLPSASDGRLRSSSCFPAFIIGSANGSLHKSVFVNQEPRPQRFSGRAWYDLTWTRQETGARARAAGLRTKAATATPAGQSLDRAQHALDQAAQMEKQLRASLKEHGKAVSAAKDDLSGRDRDLKAMKSQPQTAKKSREHVARELSQASKTTTAARR